MVERSGWFAPVSGVLFLALAACSSTSGTSTNNAGNGAEGSGSGTVSAVCSQFQAAICAYGADKCMLENRATCDGDYQTITCKNDAVAQACIDKLSVASCSAPPSECSLSIVADPAPAIASCMQLVDASCSYLVRCNVTTEASCLNQAMTSIDCSKVLGVTSSFPTCLSDLGSAACPTGQPALPASCKGTLKQFQSAPAEQGPGWHGQMVSVLGATSAGSR